MKNIASIKNTIIAVFVIGFLIIVILYYNLPQENKNVINFISIFGTFLSFFGIVFSFLQLYNIKEINAQTQAEVNKSINKINDILSISELSKAIKIIQEIQQYLHSDKKELSLLRMKDLKQILIQIQYNGKLELANNEEFNQYIVDLSIDINNISDNLLNEKKRVEVSKIISNLEEVSTILSKFENNLKFK